MVQIDPELVDRALLWCAEAGRRTTPVLVKAALGALSWDELLAVKALLADPPPVSPLGPFALADLARGAPADVAAERERAGGYGAAAAEAGDTRQPDGTPARAPIPSPPRGRKRARPPFVVRRASERPATSDPQPPPLPILDELLVDEGRAVLERLVRAHGGRRAPILGALRTGWRRADGAAIDGGDLDRLLGHHGMANAFRVRERDELLHALRAAGGVLAAAAARVGTDRASFEAALEALGARSEAERLREQRRRVLRARATLTQRTHLLLDETERVADLGLLEEFSRDLAARLPDHVRALTSASAEPPVELLCRSLSLDEKGVERLSQYTGFRPDAQPPRRAPPPEGKPGVRSPARGAGMRDRPPKGRPRPGAPPRADAKPQAGARPPSRSGSRPPGGGSHPPRTGSRPPGGGSRPPRTGSRPPGGGSRPPRTGSRPPGGGSRPPRTGNRPPPVGGSRPPRGPRSGAPGGRGGTRPPKRR